MRCKKCGFNIRSENHENGEHHKRCRGLTKHQRKAIEKHGKKTNPH
jgi:hypothetical protein